MTDKLLPCPFCGNEYPALVHLEWPEKARAIQCPDCMAFGPPKWDDSEARDAWNERWMGTGTIEVGP